jgi:hypothetical protein
LDQNKLPWQTHTHTKSHLNWINVPWTMP